MVEVKLTGFIESQNQRQEVEDGKGWIEWRVLDLYDEDKNNPEWFYVAACNQYYYDKNVLTGAGKNKNAYYIQEDFNERRLFESVKLDFDQLSFKDWDDFYNKMQHLFEYDD